MKKLQRLMAGLLCLAAVFGLAACSGGEDSSFEMDVEEVYKELMSTPDMPAMIELPEDKALDFLGLDMSRCVQAVTAISAMNIQADEIWLVEAKDSAAAAEIEQLARSRVEQRMGEFENYAPDQYQVLENAAILREGNYVVLLVSQDTEALKAAFDKAVGLD